MQIIDWEVPTQISAVLNRARRSGTARRHLRPVATTPPDLDRTPWLRRPIRWPWPASAFDVLLITATPGLADNLEDFPMLHAVATLGGFPQLVQLLALMSLVILTTLAGLTQGFRQITGTQRALLVLGGMSTTIAGAGWLVLLAFSPFVLLAILAARFL
jgi:hypothetical protein